MSPTDSDLSRIFDAKYTKPLDWGPRQRHDFRYFTPDDCYECLVDKLVRPGTAWADVGCGRDVFPSNAALARVLAQRSGRLVGIDPDPNIRDNAFVHDRFEGPLEDYRVSDPFDLVTLRMVAEHIVDPDRSGAKIAEMLKPGGLAIIYTPNRWSPVPILTSLVPNRYHHRLKRLVWDVEERDTFPTAFRLNTRHDLRRHLSKHALSEVFFAYADDCRTFNAYRPLNYAELVLQKMLRAVSIRYPENCLIGVYQKAGR